MSPSFSNLRQPSPATEMLAGAQDIVPLVVGAIPFGIIFGTLAQGSGLSFVGTLAMSAFVFAGSAQFIALGLLASGSSVPLVIITTLVVNLRHLLYAASLVPYLGHLPQRWKLPLGFWLTDEVYMVAIRHFETTKGPHQPWYYLGAALLMYGSWQLCTWLGLTAGQMLPNAAEWGLDFAMVTTFIGMVVPYLQRRPMVATVIVAGVVAIAAHDLPHQLGLMAAALAGIAAGMLADRLQIQGESHE